MDPFLGGWMPVMRACAAPGAPRVGAGVGAMSIYCSSTLVVGRKRAALSVPGAPRVGAGVGARAGDTGHLLLVILGGWEEACSTGCAWGASGGCRCRGKGWGLGTQGIYCLSPLVVGRKRAALAVLRLERLKWVSQWAGGWLPLLAPALLVSAAC